MDIVIISEFCEDFSESDNDRFLYLAKILISDYKDNKVEIITSSFRHTTKRHRRDPIVGWPFKITFVEEPGYPKNVCLKRFYSHYVWGKNVLNYIKNREKRPDVIYCAVPSLTGPNIIAKYCEKENIRFIIDVQDLWPEAFQMVLNIPIISNIIFAPLKLLANGIYKRADAICAVSDTYCERAAKVNPKVKDTTAVFLGTELDLFDSYAAEKPIFEKKDGEIWLAYCGTLGNSYDIRCVIDALTILNNGDIRFIVMGDGPKKDEFEAYAKDKGVNATFVGRLTYNSMCSLLSACDITVNPIAHKSAGSIINKHADYAASGKPVVSTQENYEYRNLIDQYHMGFNCRNSNSVDLAEKINILINDKKMRMKMGRNARRCAKKMFDRKNSYREITRLIMREY